MHALFLAQQKQAQSICCHMQWSENPHVSTFLSHSSTVQEQACVFSAFLQSEPWQKILMNMDF